MSAGSSHIIIGTELIRLPNQGWAVNKILRYVCSVVHPEMVSRAKIGKVIVAKLDREELPLDMGQLFLLRSIPDRTGIGNDSDEKTTRAKFH